MVCYWHIKEKKRKFYRLYQKKVVKEKQTIFFSFPYHDSAPHPHKSHWNHKTYPAALSSPGAALPTVVWGRQTSRRILPLHWLGTDSWWDGWAPGDVWVRYLTVMVDRYGDRCVNRVSECYGWDRQTGITLTHLDWKLSVLHASFFAPLKTWIVTQLSSLSGAIRYCGVPLYHP